MEGKSCHESFGLQTSEPLFLLNTLVPSVTLVLVWFFFSQTGTSVRLSGRKEIATDPYFEARAHPHSLPRLLKGCGETSAFSLKKKKEQTTYLQGQRATLNLQGVLLQDSFKWAESLPRSIFEPKGTRADVSENAGTANARLTSAFTRPRLRIRPCPYFIPKHTYHLERSEWKRVSKCFKPCTCIVSQNSLGSSSAYLKSPTATLWVSALLKAICIFSFHQIGLWLAGAVSGLLQTPVLARVCWQSVKN